VTYSLRVRPAAERDVDEAVQWYGARAPQQVDRLIRELATRLSEIQVAPRMYPVAYRSVRRAPLRVFPYFVWFVVDADSEHIEVLAVTHQRRDPAGVQAKLT
jgi:plasmid stabilization system protein ParE